MPPTPIIPDTLPILPRYPDTTKGEDVREQDSPDTIRAQLLLPDKHPGEERGARTGRGGVVSGRTPWPIFSTRGREEHVRMEVDRERIKEDRKEVKPKGARRQTAKNKVTGGRGRRTALREGGPAQQTLQQMGWMGKGRGSTPGSTQGARVDPRVDSGGGFNHQHLLQGQGPDDRL